MLSLIIFVTIFIYFSNWKRFKFLPKVLLNPKRNLKQYHNNKLVDNLSKKLGVKFEIKVQKSQIINGYMPGIPKKPVMILTQGAIDKLTPQELEWMILHEAGHCLKWHTLKNTIAWMIFLLLGVALILNLMLSPFQTIIMALLLSLLWIQFERRSEVEADRYSLDKGADPKAMISFFEKMNNEHPNIIYRNEWLGFFLSPHPNYKKRIAMAQAKLLLIN